MKSKISLIIILNILTILLTSQSVKAESLFRLGIDQNSFPMQPKSLFSSIRAKTIGDMVTIILNEKFSNSDAVTMKLTKTSSTTDNFSDRINKLLPGTKYDLANFDGYGGNSTVNNTSTVSRQSTMTDTITVQVVQVMPNGNIVVQGKKTLINAKERVEFLISGIIDPRFIDNTGKINSNLVSNLQIAATGKGAISKGQSEGTFNKLIRVLF
jgi:flagellar L-ring protein precursor FlgH